MASTKKSIADCIYCRSPITKHSSEHVIPQAFGTFGSKTPVLRCVCHDCNQLFSREFEREVYRSSLEALQRWKHGLKSGEPAEDVDGRRVSLKAAGGEFDGLRLNPVTNDIEAQVEFKRRDGGPSERFTLADLRRMRKEDLTEFDLTLPHELIVWKKGQYEEFNAELKRLGYEVTYKGDSRKKNVPAGTNLGRGAMTVTMDQKLGRAMAKIAFNYLAFMCGGEFVLRPDFDPIRNFIRNNVPPPFSCIIAQGMQENADRGGFINDPSHFLLLCLQDRGSIVYGRVSLFSGHTYHVALCKFYSSLYIPAQLVSGIGHRFDVKKRHLEPLGRNVLEYLNSPRYSY